MSGMLAIFAVWVLCWAATKGLDKYLAGEKTRLNAAVKRLLVLLSMLTTVATLISEAGDVLLQPPHTTPVNYEEVYTAPLKIEMNVHGFLGQIQLPFLEIYYTTDGSDPATSESAVKYSGPFEIFKSTSFTARSRFFGVLWSELEAPSPYYRIAPEDKAYIRAEEISILGKTSLTVGEKAVMEAVVTPENATDTEVYWTSSAPQVVSVDRQTGEITALLAGGPVIITARAAVGDLSAQVEVRVLGGEEDTQGGQRPEAGTTVSTPAPVPTLPPSPSLGPVGVESLRIEPGWMSLTVGESAWLSAFTEPVGAVTDLYWSSTEETVATVTGDGYVTAWKEGVTEVQVTAGNGMTAWGLVEVLAPEPEFIEVSSLEVWADDPVVLDAYGTGVKIDAWVLPYDATEQRLRWYSEDESVVEVTDDGVLFPGEAGWTTVWVEDWEGRYAQPISVEVVGISQEEDFSGAVDVQGEYFIISQGEGARIGIEISGPAEASELYIESVYTDVSTGEEEARLFGPLTEFDSCAEAWFSTTISAEEYDLSYPGTYRINVLLCSDGKQGVLEVMAQDTFWIEVAY